MGNPPTEFVLERIYIRDLSFESPRAPESFREPWQPQLQLDLNTRTNGLNDERYEVVLTVTVHAKSAAGQTIMIVEVQQGGVFRIRGLREDQLRRVLATNCPGILFPYIRETIDTLVVKGGFPPLMLAPVNFDGDVRRGAEAQPAVRRPALTVIVASAARPDSRTGATLRKPPPKPRCERFRLREFGRIGIRRADSLGIESSTAAGRPRVSGPNSNASPDLNSKSLIV